MNIPNDGLIRWHPGMDLEELERQHIMISLKYFHGNKTATANALKISVRTLDNKLEKYETDHVEQLERDAERRREQDRFLAKARGQSIPEPGIAASARNGVESFKDIATKQPVPVPKRVEVQELPPKQVAVGGNRKGR